MQDLLKNLSRDVVNVAASIMNKTPVVVESTELEEANKANKAKSSAFRAGKKAEIASNMSTKAYHGRWDSKEEKKEKNDAAAAKKDAAKDKAAKMQLAAKDRLRALGKSTKGAITPFNKGKEVQKKAGESKERPIDSKISHNVSAKEMDSPAWNDKWKGESIMKRSGESRGRFKQMHDTRQHEIVKRKIDDLHRDIRSKLNDLEPKYDGAEKEGSSAIEKAKAHLAKMEKIHATLHESIDVEDFNEVIEETLELVETVVVLSELYGETE